MKIVRNVLALRDQEITSFSGMLWRLCDASGAYGAALVDGQGETVDYAGRVDPFDMRVAAAEWRLILHLLQSSTVNGWQTTDELVVRSAKHSFFVWALGDGYAVVLILARRAFRVSRRALAEAALELEQEAGLSRRGPTERVHWLRVDVRTEERDRTRPMAVWQDRAWRPLTIVGRFQSQDLARSEIGYLTRLESGDERILVREPTGRWFLGEST